MQEIGSNFERNELCHHKSESFTFVFLFFKDKLLYLKDPRVSEEHNTKFLDMMERYYNQPDEQKMKHVFPELNYSRGVNPFLNTILIFSTDLLIFFKKRQRQNLLKFHEIILKR